MSGFKLHSFMASPGVAYIDLGSPEGLVPELHGTTSDPVFPEYIDLSSPDRMEEVFFAGGKMFDDLLKECSSPEVTHPAFTSFLPSEESPVETIQIREETHTAAFTSSTSQAGAFSSSLLAEEDNPVDVIHPPPQEVRHVWMLECAAVLPRDILRRAPRRRGKRSSMEYEPCAWDEFIARVAQRYKAPAAKRQRRQLQQPDEEGSTNPVVVAYLAQEVVYGAASYFDLECLQIV